MKNLFQKEVKKMTFLQVFLIACFVGGLSSGPVTTGTAFGDIREMNKDMADMVESDIKPFKFDPNREIQHGLTSNLARKWPDKTVPYTIAPAFSQSDRNVIFGALQEIEQNTCLKFVLYNETTAPFDHVSVIASTGCWSYIGRIVGKQELSLQLNGCVVKYIIMHEFIHALGVYHEQSRKDRDNYVEILFDNIQSGRENNFEIRDTDSLGVEYDPKSVMHYDNKAFSRNGLDTIQWKTNSSLALGGTELTNFDIQQLNLFYCTDSTTTTTTTTPTTTTTTTPTTTTTTPTTTTPTTTTTTTTPTTTTPTTTTTTPTTTTTTTPTTTTTTTPTTPQPQACGDKVFLCVKAYVDRRLCSEVFYQSNCLQTCGKCTEINCENFQDQQGCASRASNGECESTAFVIRLRAKNECTKSCCERGTLYTQ